MNLSLHNAFLKLPAALLILLPVLAGCGPAPSGYFPLEEGRLWDYRITRTIRGETQEQRLILASLPPADLEGNRYYPRRRLDGRTELFQSTPEGILHVEPASGVRTRVLPGEQQAGSKWAQSTHIYFLEVTGAFSETFRERGQQAIPLESVVESDNDTVEVGAGTFTNCLRVRSTGSVFAGGTLKEFMGISFIKVDQTEWYAPGIGLVKRVRKEHTTPAKWSNEYVEELLEVN